MDKKRFLPVSMRFDSFYNGKEIRNSINFKFIDWIYTLGYHPIVIPNNMNCIKFFEMFKFDGIILSGGNEVSKKTVRNSLQFQLLNISKKKYSCFRYLSRCSNNE